jgi:methylated-DNA-[protein]-cysteine S-methyltransferase
MSKTEPASISWRSLHSPVGDLTVYLSNDKITVLEWGRVPNDIEGSNSDHPVLLEACEQLNDYFDGKRQEFDLPLDPEGSDFQKAVWQAMCEIPAGKTRTYGSVANELESAAQPVGTACGANPIPIIIPCHRIVAKEGLGGFSGQGGVETKKQLLRLEGVAIQGQLL